MNVLDTRRLLEKGHWRQTKEASDHHVTNRDSESDTDIEEEAFVRIEPNKQYSARKAAPTPSSESEADVAEIISDDESQKATEASMEAKSPPSEGQKSPPNERIFMKKRNQAKAGANNSVEVTHIIAKETPHTFTLVNGKVVRKNEMRKCSDTPEPPVGTFGTPCKLLRERVFVHPENTKKHEQCLARETRKSSRKRAAYKAKGWEEKQRSAKEEKAQAVKSERDKPRESKRPR